LPFFWIILSNKKRIFPMNGLRKKVLMIDDDRLIVMLLKDIIKTAGYDVETASKGKEAWEKIQNYRPDLIVLDIMLPEISGFEIARRMKADERLKHIPIIMLTALRSPADVTDAKLAGAVEVLLKPLPPETLLERIKFHFKKPLMS
jgi:two-component system, sensor histidine kinase and response regulator